MTIRVSSHQLKRELYRNNTTVCDNIKLLRLIHGKNQTELSDLLGISRTAYHAIEIGKKIPEFDLVAILSDFYDVDMDYMVSFNIADQMLNMIKSDNEETKADRFLERYMDLSYRGKEHIKEEILKIREYEDKFRKFPWKYDERPELYSPCTLVNKRKELERNRINGSKSRIIK